MDQLPKENPFSSFFVGGQVENEQKYKRFERLSEIFTWLAIVLGILVIQLPFGQDLNRQAIYFLAAIVGVFVTVWYHLLPKKFSGRIKRFIYNLITITFIALLVHNANGVAGYAIFFYFLAMLSVSMTLPLFHTVISGLYVIILITAEGFFTPGLLKTNLSLAVLHSWALVLIVYFSRYNAGEASLVKRGEEEVLLEKERALGRLKDEFVYIISQKLKQPAATIKSVVETILTKYSDSLNPETKEILDLTNVNSARLEKLLEDLLDISQIQKGSLRIHLTDVSLKPIVSEVLSTLFLDAKNKRISLLQKTNEEVASKGDADRIKEILTNLVGNAIKYTPEGGKVTVELTKEGEFAKILVSDNGIGISDEDQKHLFEKFYRVEREETKSVKGSGLGLFITKQLVEKMGGKIGFTSNLVEGTTFYFTMPRYRW